MWGSLSSAAVTLVGGPSGASNVIIDQEKYYIYAGFAGNCVGTSTSETCDSCFGDGLIPCNRTNAYPTLRLIVQLNLGRQGLTAGDIKFKIGNSDVRTPSIAPVVSGDVASVNLEWGADICASVNSGDTGCTTPLNSTLSIGFQASGETGSYMEFQVITRYVDTSVAADQFYQKCDKATGSDPAPNQGFCDFGVKRGDEKVYLDSSILNWGSAYPATGASGVEYSNLLFFFNDAGFAGINTITNQDDYFSIQTAKDLSPPIEDDRIDGLENGVEFCFIMANQDRTGIISHFTDPSTVTAAGVCATPDQVIGLLDDKKCFIATAAFGSDMAPEVQSFREFRNKFLLTNTWGKSFVQFYYEHSPKYAKIIAHNDILKASARVVLWPLLGFAKLSILIGVLPSLMLLVMLLAGGLALLHISRRRLQRGEA